jgi:predicted ATPase
MIHLRSLQFKDSPLTPDHFPHNLPIIRALDALTFERDVTFLVGENGSGKSTLLETLACAVGSITVGAESVETDPTLAHIRELAKRCRLTWNKRTKRGFFMRSEDFFNFVRGQQRMKAEMQAELQRIDEEYADRDDYAKGLARMPYARELHAMRSRYGEDLDANSHGETYFTLFQSRFVPGGLYLLDEPEAPLSPLRQLSLMAMIKDMLEQDAQFIIATHSPILLAYPNATILHFEGDQITPTAYDDLEHVTLTRDFLNNPSAFLGHLLG